MQSYDLIGISGASIILIAFVMNQTKKWRDDFLVYDAFNFVGSVLLIIYAIVLKSYPFIILNSVWAIISLRDVFVDLKRKNFKHQTAVGKKGKKIVQKTEIKKSRTKNSKQKK